MCCHVQLCIALCSYVLPSVADQTRDRSLSISRTDPVATPRDHDTPAVKDRVGYSTAGRVQLPAGWPRAVSPLRSAELGDCGRGCRMAPPWHALTLCTAWYMHHGRPFTSLESGLGLGLGLGKPLLIVQRVACLIRSLPSQLRQPEPVYA